MKQYDIMDDINQNELMIKKHKKVYRILNYIEDLLVLIFTVTGYISISAFASLVGYQRGLASII